MSFQIKTLTNDPAGQYSIIKVPVCIHQHSNFFFVSFSFKIEYYRVIHMHHNLDPATISQRTFSHLEEIANGINVLRLHMNNLTTLKLVTGWQPVCQCYFVYSWLKIFLSTAVSFERTLKYFCIVQHTICYKQEKHFFKFALSDLNKI